MLRFLLGAAEAGFFPGVILYITYWYPAHYRAIIVGIFMVAIPVAGLIGSPISGGILYMDGLLGLGGWQWIFLLEAVPAVLLGVASFVWLTDRPEHATWLTGEQQQWLIAKLDGRTPPRAAHLARLGLARDDQQIRADHGAGVFRRGRRLDVARAVDAATGEVVRADQLADRPAERRAVRHRRGVDDPVGPQLRPQRRARVAQRTAAGLDGAGDGRDVLRDRQPVGDDPAADADRGRHLRQQGAVLGAVVGMARRGVRRGRAGADQRARQPVGFRLQLPDRLDPGGDRQLPAGADADRGGGGDRHHLACW